MIEPEELLQPTSRGGLVGALRPAPYLQAFRELLILLSKRRALSFEMAKRELSSEHSGKALGGFWGWFQPLFLLAVYAFIYGVVFRAKIGGTFELPRNFTIYLLSGLVPWFSFQFCMARAAGVIVGNAGLVKQVVFDLNVLPIASALAAVFSLLLGLAFITAYTLAEYGSLPLTYLALPAIVLSQFFAMSGVAFALASLGTFIRDVRDIVQLSAVVLIFLMPIVYLPNQVPGAFNPLLWLNPFTYMVYCYQDVLYFGRFQHIWSWVAFPIWSLFIFAAGYRLFRRVRPHFANVL
jgi:lipopolysaccharide transport system permease protein